MLLDLGQRPPRPFSQKMSSNSNSGFDREQTDRPVVGLHRPVQAGLACFALLDTNRLLAISGLEAISKAPCQPQAAFVRPPYNVGSRAACPLQLEAARSVAAYRRRGPSGGSSPRLSVCPVGCRFFRSSCSVRLACSVGLHGPWCRLLVGPCRVRLPKGCRRPGSTRRGFPSGLVRSAPGVATENFSFCWAFVARRGAVFCE